MFAAGYRTVRQEREKGPSVQAGHALLPGPPCVTGCAVAANKGIHHGSRGRDKSAGTTQLSLKYELII